MSAKKKAKTVKAKPKGRPSGFRKDMLQHARFLAERGFTDADMAEFFGVAVSTVAKWKVDFPDFSDALKAGKAIADSRVVRSLYERATGYSHPDVHVSNFQGEITVTQLTKHYPPDTTACIFWLKNRQKEGWRDKVDHEHSGAVEIEVTIGGTETE